MLSNAPTYYLLNRRIALLDHGRLSKNGAPERWLIVRASDKNKGPEQTGWMTSPTPTDKPNLYAGTS